MSVVQQCYLKHIQIMNHTTDMRLISQIPQPIIPPPTNHRKETNPTFPPPHPIQRTNPKQTQIQQHQAKINITPPPSHPKKSHPKHNNTTTPHKSPHKTPPLQNYSSSSSAQAAPDTPSAGDPAGSTLPAAGGTAAGGTAAVGTARTGPAGTAARSVQFVAGSRWSSG